MLGLSTLEPSKQPGLNDGVFHATVGDGYVSFSALPRNRRPLSPIEIDFISRPPVTWPAFGSHAQAHTC